MGLLGVRACALDAAGHASVAAGHASVARHIPGWDDTEARYIDSVITLSQDKPPTNNISYTRGSPTNCRHDHAHAHAQTRARDRTLNHRTILKDCWHQNNGEV